MIVEYNCRGNCPRGSLRGRLELRLGVVPDLKLIDQEGGLGAMTRSYLGGGVPGIRIAALITSRDMPAALNPQMSQRVFELWFL